MGRSPQLKPKRATKSRSNSLKVDIKFGKKTPVKRSTSKINHLGADQIPTPAVNPLPLHCSTPKPQPKASQPNNSIQTSTTQLLGDKKLMVVLERIRIEDYIPPKLTGRAKPKAALQPKVAKVKLVKAGQTYPRKIATKKSKLTKLKEAAPCLSETSVTTQIPSEVLHNFGILSDQQTCLHSPTRSNVSLSKTAHIETPPQTSTACSSHNSDDNILNHTSPSSEDEQSLLPAFSVPVPSTLLQAIQPSKSNHLLYDLYLEPVPLANVSSTSQRDPLDTRHLVHEPDAESSPVSVHWELLFGLKERLYQKPAVYHLDELTLSCLDIRKIAPYSLKPNLTKDQYFLYAAPIVKLAEQFYCLIFGVVDGFMVAYGGHFIVNGNHLYDPVKKVEVDTVELTDSIYCRPHLGLLNIPNKMLIGTDNYYPQALHSAVQDVQLASLDIFTSSIDQIQFKERTRSELMREQFEARLGMENIGHFDATRSLNNSVGMNIITFTLPHPRTEQVFRETCLPINNESVGRILNFVVPSEEVKTIHGDMGSLLLKCDRNSKFETPYYVAYETPGCTCFYPNAFILGHHDNHFIAGVVIKDAFFIFATKRLYSRFDSSLTLKPVVFRPEMLEVIVLPLWLLHDVSLVMLETRQVFRHPHSYQRERQQIIESLDIRGLEIPRAFLHTKFNTMQQYSSWLEIMVNEHFSASFQNSLYEFPDEPAQSSNPVLFAENLTKLWVHQLIRKIRGIPDAASKPNMDPREMPLSDFFTMDASTFVQSFLRMFGMTNDSKFQCQRLGPDGLPTSVCLESLPARQVGLHVYQCHTLPLQWNADDVTKEVGFIPFRLVYQKDQSRLSEQWNDANLSWARSVVDRWSRGSKLSYLELLNAVAAEEKEEQTSGAVCLDSQQKLTRLKSPTKKVVERKKKKIVTRSSPKKRMRMLDQDKTGSSSHHQFSSNVSESSNE